jgi:hypothetical protein
MPYASSACCCRRRRHWRCLKATSDSPVAEVGRARRQGSVIRGRGKGPAAAQAARRRSGRPADFPERRRRRRRNGQDQASTCAARNKWRLALEASQIALAAGRRPAADGAVIDRPAGCRKPARRQIDGHAAGRRTGRRRTAELARGLATEHAKLAAKRESMPNKLARGWIRDRPGLRRGDTGRHCKLIRANCCHSGWPWPAASSWDGAN